jgi:hypothetical protein
LCCRNTIPQNFRYFFTIYFVPKIFNAISLRVHSNKLNEFKNWEAFKFLSHNLTIHRVSNYAGKFIVQSKCKRGAHYLNHRFRWAEPEIKNGGFSIILVFFPLCTANFNSFSSWFWMPPVSNRFNFIRIPQPVFGSQGGGLQGRNENS